MPRVQQRRDDIEEQFGLSNPVVVHWQSLYLDGEHIYIWFCKNYDRVLGTAEVSPHRDWSGKTPLEIFDPHDAAAVIARCLEEFGEPE